MVTEDFMLIVNSYRLYKRKTNGAQKARAKCFCGNKWWRNELWANNICKL